MAFTRRELALVATAAALVFSRVFGLSAVMPGFVQYAQGLPGSTDLLVGVAFGAYGLTLALMQLPLGLLSDRIGRRPVLALGTLMFVAGSLWAGMADSMATMIAARLVQGLGAVSSAAMAMVGETLPAERRTIGMALIGIPAGGGFFVGLMVGAWFDVQWLFFAAGGMGLLAGLPLIWLRPGEAQPAGPQATGGPVMTLAAAGFVMNFALTTVMFYLGATGRAEGRALFVPLLFALVFMAVASRAIDKRGLTWQPVAVGLLVLAVGAVGSVLSAWWWVALFFAAHATLAAVVPSQVSRVAGASGGRGHDIQNIVAYMGTFAGGTLGGWAIQVPELPLSLLLLLAVAVSAASLGMLRYSQRTEIPRLGSEQG